MPWLSKFKGNIGMNYNSLEKCEIQILHLNISLEIRLECTTSV